MDVRLGELRMADHPTGSEARLVVRDREQLDAARSGRVGAARRLACIHHKTDEDWARLWPLPRPSLRDSAFGLAIFALLRSVV